MNSNLLVSVVVFHSVLIPLASSAESLDDIDKAIELKRAAYDSIAYEVTDVFNLNFGEDTSVAGEVTGRIEILRKGKFWFKRVDVNGVCNETFMGNVTKAKLRKVDIYNSNWHYSETHRDDVRQQASKTEFHWPSVWSEDKKEEYTMEVLPDKIISGIDCFTVKGMTKEKQSEEVIWYISKQHGVTIQTTYRSKLGSRIVTCSNIKTNVEIPESRFTFTDPPKERLYDAQSLEIWLPTIIDEGEVETLRQVLEDKALDIEESLKTAPTPIHRAVAADSREIVQMLLDYGYSINTEDFGGEVPLDNVCSEEMYDFLVKRGAKYSDPVRAAFTAAHRDNHYCVRKAFEVGKIDPNTIDPFFSLKSTILHVCAGWTLSDDPPKSIMKRWSPSKDDAFKTILYLKQLGAPVNALDADGFTPLDRSSSSRMDAFLKGLGAKSSGNKEVYRAAYFAGNYKKSADLIRKLKPEDLEKGNGRYMFLASCGLGYFEIVDAICNSGMNIDFVDEEGDVPFIEFCRNVELQNETRNRLIKSFLKAGVDINRKDAEGKTALHVLVRVGDLESIVLLAKAGGDCSSETKLGCTPLFYLLHVGDVSKNWREILAFLVEQKVDLDKKDRDGKTALMRACERGIEVFAEALLKYGADPGVPDSDGNSALHIVAAANDAQWKRELANILLLNGADPRLRNKNGKTPKDVCVDAKIAKLIQSALDGKLQDKDQF